MKDYNEEYNQRMDRFEDTLSFIGNIFKVAFVLGLAYYLCIKW